MRMGLPEKVAIMRFKYHANMTSVVNVANQLHIISDDKAEKLNANHVMTIFTDILPRLTGLSAEGVLEQIKKKKEEES